MRFESPETLSLNIQRIFLESMYNTAALLGKERKVTANRQVHAPYVVKNMTGYTISVWTEPNNANRNIEMKQLEHGESIPWKFEDWKKMREVSYNFLYYI